MIRMSIRRPVAVAMAYGAVALLGAFAWRNIPIELMPDTQLPTLLVHGYWWGASPETTEAFLTSPLEAAIQQVKGVQKITSDSGEQYGRGTATITVEFNRDTDMDFARMDLSERISTLQETLPEGVDRVTVDPYIPDEFKDQHKPFLSYVFTGPYTLEALRQHLDDVVKPELQQVDGVAAVTVAGGRKRLLDIELDENKIAALGLDPWTVRSRIQALDLVREAGTIREGADQRTITIVNRPGSAEDVRNAIISAAGPTPVRVSDVASVHDAYEEATSYKRIDGSPAVTFTVIREIGANAVRVADAVKAQLATLELQKPYGSHYILQDDESKDIRRQLSDLRARAGFSALVIFIVLLGFLRSLRSAALVFATIAFSVLIALNLIYFGGLSLNILTLMGLAMGFGLIVDNSIVVLENVYRRWQRGEEPASAADGGTREVVLPILASTATTLIVFVPFVYLQGDLRVFYVPLAIVVGLTLMASLFVAFTFIPAVAARLLALGRGPRHQVAPEDGEAFERRPPLYVRFYSEVVALTVRHPWFAMGVTVLIFAGSYYLFDKYVTTWTVWGGGYNDRSYISVTIRLPRGSNLERTDQLVGFFEDKLSHMPEVEQYTADVYETYAYMKITFPDSLENTQIPPAIKDQMYSYSLSFTGAEVYVQGFGPSFYGGGSSPPNYAIMVLGYNYEKVRDIAEDIGRRVARLSRVQEVDTNSSSGFFNRDRASEYVVHVDRDRLARYSLTVAQLIQRLSAAVGGRTAQVAHLKIGGEDVEYEVKLAGNQDMDVLALKETLIDTPDGRRIRLGDVVTIEPRDVLARIHRENQQYERTVTYEFRGPTKLGDVYHKAIIDNTAVPPGYTVKKSDSYWWINPEQRGEIALVMAVSLVLIYMVTAALFESLLQPLCVILTVPMALIGVYLIFFYTGASFTREAYVGVIMMFGIVVNNAILLVDHVNGVRRRNPDMALAAAIVKGTLERVRPILMTTATTVVGLLPLVLFGKGAGSNIWDALAYVLIGGLLSSTMFVLTITPAVYGVLERWKLQARGVDVSMALTPSLAPAAPPEALPTT
jgi:hydrophobic/amphiphilic exporter-1 (mainly G- bacteria), HAE1 family